MKVSLIDKKGKKHRYFIGYSFLYLFFGPFYSLIRGRIIYSLIIMLYHFLLIPKSLITKFYELLQLDAKAISILIYPHNNFDIFTYLVILLIPRIIVAIFIDNHYFKIAINKKFMLPATDVDLEKIASKFPEYKDLPIDLSFVEKQVFLPNQIENDNVKTPKSVLDLDENNLNQREKEKIAAKEKYIEQQLNILYGKYESGFISEEQLIKEKNKIINDK